MGWEKRGNRKYYYRKIRKGKKVISQYIGAGPEAERIALEDEIERRKGQILHKAWAQKKDEILAVDDILDSMDELIRQIINAQLLLAGFHCHKGQWRRRQNVKR